MNVPIFLSSLDLCEMSPTFHELTPGAPARSFVAPPFIQEGGAVLFGESAIFQRRRMFSLHRRGRRTAIPRVPTALLSSRWTVLRHVTCFRTLKRNEAEAKTHGEKTMTDMSTTRRMVWALRRLLLRLMERLARDHGKVSLLRLTNLLRLCSIPQIDSWCCRKGVSSTLVRPTTAYSICDSTISLVPTAMQRII